MLGNGFADSFSVTYRITEARLHDLPDMLKLAEAQQVDCMPEQVDHTSSLIAWDQEQMLGCVICRKMEDDSRLLMSFVNKHDEAQSIRQVLVHKACMKLLARGDRRCRIHLEQQDDDPTQQLLHQAIWADNLPQAA